MADSQEHIPKRLLGLHPSGSQGRRLEMYRFGNVAPSNKTSKKRYSSRSVLLEYGQTCVELRWLTHLFQLAWSRSLPLDKAYLIAWGEWGSPSARGNIVPVTCKPTCCVENQGVTGCKHVPIQHPNHGPTQSFGGWLQILSACVANRYLQHFHLYFPFHRFRVCVSRSTHT